MGLKILKKRLEMQEGLYELLKEQVALEEDHAMQLAAKTEELEALKQRLNAGNYQDNRVKVSYSRLAI